MVKRVCIWLIVQATVKQFIIPKATQGQRELNKVQNNCKQIDFVVSGQVVSAVGFTVYDNFKL